MKNKNIEHIWTIVCSRSVLDSETNNLSLNNVIEKFTVPLHKDDIEKSKKEGSVSFMINTEFEVVSLLRNTEKEKAGIFDTRIRLLNPKGESLATAHEQKIALKEGVSNLRLRSRFNQLLVQESGVYTVVMDIKSVEETEYIQVGSIPLEVEINIVG
jgi:hypothetical protein